MRLVIGAIEAAGFKAFNSAFIGWRLVVRPFEAPRGLTPRVPFFQALVLDPAGLGAGHA